jgi:glucans biosynthesis protein
MTDRVDRRTLLKGAAATAAGLAASSSFAAEAAEALRLAEPVAFSYEGFKAHAREMARTPYVGPARPMPQVVQKINYEEWGKIKFRTDHALFADGPGRFPIEFFHLGLFFQKAVDLHVIENGQSRKIIYDQAYFDMPADSIARQLPQGAGFAGFRIQESRDGDLDWHKNDWVAFLGAAYFRSIGELRQYGLSARGIALDVAVADRSEEFPDFTNFYIESNQGPDNVVI